MSYILIVIAVLVVVFVFSRLRGNTPSLEAVQTDLDNGALLIDVRSSAEFSGGHAKGAKNISLQSIQSGTLPSQDKQKTIYIYCHSGARASRASSILRRSGFNKVVNLGGLSKWRSMGGAVTK